MKQTKQPVTIERTSKEYKFGMLTGRLLIVLGIIGILYSLWSYDKEFGQLPSSLAELLEDQKSVYVSSMAIPVGFIIFYFEKFLAWWNNG